MAREFGDGTPEEIDFRANRKRSTLSDRQCRRSAVDLSEPLVCKLGIRAGNYVLAICCSEE